LADTNGSRTHEPNLRELTAQLDGLKELLNTRITSVETVMNERHQLYKERADSQKVAVDDALAAAKEQTSASFAASEKAIVKAEESQRTYNQGHNDLSRKMESQYATMVPQPEAKLKWDAIDKALEEMRKETSIARTNEQVALNALRTEMMREIQSLRESRSVGTGKEEARYAGTQQGNWRAGTIIAVALGLSSLLISSLGVVVLIFRK
jgi:hypothetical protein